jgi:hypothetical protein
MVIRFIICTFPNIIGTIKSSRMRWAEHVASVGRMRNAYKISIGKPQRQGLPIRPKRRCEHTVVMDLQEMGGERADWIHIVQKKDDLGDLWTWQSSLISWLAEPL